MDKELLEFIALLPNSKYTEKDRYNEFRKFFMGSEAGKRILVEILSWGKLFDTGISASPIDQIAMNIRAGEQNIARKLLHVVNNEPPEKLKQTTRKRR